MDKMYFKNISHVTMHIHTPISEMVTRIFQQVSFVGPIFLTVLFLSKCYLMSCILIVYIIHISVGIRASYGGSNARKVINDGGIFFTLEGTSVYHPCTVCISKRHR